MFDWLKKFFSKDKPTAEPVQLDVGADGRYGIQTLTPMMDAVLNLGLAIYRAGQDGLTFRDAIQLAGPIMDAGGTFKHVGQAKLELLDLTPSETHTLVLILSARLPELPSNKAAIIIEAALQCAPGLVHFVQTVALVLSVPDGQDIPRAVEVRALAEPARIKLPQPAEPERAPMVQTAPQPAPIPAPVVQSALAPVDESKEARRERILNTPVAPGSQAIPRDRPPGDARGSERLGEDTIAG
jgi:hypothetical protein